MNQTRDELWLEFEALAKTYPRDEGVGITAHLVRWLVEERQRLQGPIPAVLRRVAETVAKGVVSPDSARGCQSPATSV
jgi:hypothetical protein